MLTIILIISLASLIISSITLSLVLRRTTQPQPNPEFVAETSDPIKDAELEKQLNEHLEMFEDNI